jgi:RNA recognition motif-containing protein
MTAADSCNIVLSNLPPDSNTAEIHTLAASFGVVKELAFLGEAADSATVSIEFARPEDAVAAVKQLNDQKFGSKLILAKLDSRTPVFARSPLHSQMLMVSWPGATLVGWSYYPSITIAKAVAAKLDKTSFKDRKIGAVFERPGKKGPYAIRLTNLPPGATKAELDAFCTDPTPNLTTLGEPSYSQSPEDSIRDELKKYGRVEGFRVCPQDDGAFRTIAYVTMQTYSAADEAARALDKTTPSYLGKATLEVKHIYLASYKVLPEIFECIRDRLGIIRDSHKDQCTILDDFDGYTHNVELRSSIDESTSFAEANVELGKLIDGSLILDEEGGRLWDPYLNLPSSAKAVNKINDPNSDVPCFVHCDKRLQCVRVYGSADGQVRGKKTLLKILKKVSEQCHEIELDRAAQIATLVEGGLVRLQGSLGGNKISLNIVDARLTVRGTAEDLETAKGIVSELATSPSSSPSGLAVGSNLCPLCERVPVSPVRLTCRHAYCQACLQFALASTAKRDFNTLSPFFACIAPLRSSPKSQAGGPDAVVQRCNAPLSYVVVRDNLTTSQENLYLNAVFTASVRTSAGRFFFCPTPNCSVVHRAGEEGIVVRCPECSSDVCPKCSRRIHDGSLCEV